MASGAGGAGSCVLTGRGRRSTPTRRGARCRIRSRTAPAPPTRSNGNRPVDKLDLIEPPAYFRALAGVEVPDGGMIPCPLPDHEDSHASCQVFEEPERGWWCYGCSRGGRIYDLASLMAGGPWGRDLREDAFLQARDRAASTL
jgi:hypothetical protein